MPKPKRPPIDYKPQFSDTIFRPKDVVANELDTLRPQAPIPETNDTERPSDRTNVRTNERPDERIRVRHSFDVYQDQLLALSQIQADIFRKTARKPKIGELVQEAIDAYITRMQEPDERSNDRMTG